MCYQLRGLRLSRRQDRYRWFSKTPLDREAANDPNAWLELNAAGFSHLQQDERRAIYHFALLWSLFEAKLLATHGSPGAIIDAVAQFDAANRLDPASVAGALAYFRDRYWHDGRLTSGLASSPWRRSTC